MASLDELEPLATSAGAYAFAVALGLLWGSFANVCIFRWPPTPEFPKGRSVVKPGSHCFACGKPVRWYDNVPLLAYLWLRGRCRDCGATFSARYLIVEAVTGALFGVAWWAAVSAGVMFEPLDLRLIRFVVFAAFIVVMVVIAFIDLDTGEILDRVSLPSIVLFYGLGMLLPGQRWSDGLIGAAIGFGVPWAIGEAYYLLRKRDGLGLGDAKLLAVIGALLGWRGVVASLFGGSLVGIVIGLVVAITQRRRGAAVWQPGVDAAAADAADAADAAALADPTAAAAAADPPALHQVALPFGPFLVIAALFYLFAEPWISLHFRFTGG